MARGLFIVLEGPDGGGKTTLAKRLVAHIKLSDTPVTYAREPGGSQVSEQIRVILKNPENTDMSDECELMLFAAARSEFVNTVLSPTLDAGTNVICDRFTNSTVAYQGAGRGINIDTIHNVNDIVVGSNIPDLTIILDCPVLLGEERSGNRVDVACRMEQTTLEFKERVRASYLDQAKYDDTCIVISASGTLDESFEDIISELHKNFPDLFK